MFRKIFSITILILLAVSANCFAAGRFDFVIIQPGQPGSTADAQPVMDSLAKYISSKLGCEVGGTYFNELQPALKYLKENKPAWAISGFTFFKSYKDEIEMHPLASTRPQGFEKDIWRVIVPADGPSDIMQLKGTVYGSMFYTPQAVKILLGSEKTPAFTAEGTYKALRMLRKVNKGKASGVCLDAVQYSVIEGSSRYANTKVIYESEKLPSSPVVWFGKTDDDSLRLQAVLLDMAKDPAAKEILKLLQTDGFGPAAEDLK